MKICILSDSHDHRQLLAAAVAEARGRGAEAVLHCGDIIAPSTLHVAQPYGLPMHVIHGNNQGDVFHLAHLARDSAQGAGGAIHYHGQDARLTIAGRRIFLVHYPHYGRALALTGDYDLVCIGHEHRAHVERVANVRGGETVLVNPGTVGGVGKPPTWVLADLATMAFEIVSVRPEFAEPPGSEHD